MDCSKLFSILAIFLCSSVQAATVEEAYRAIPHRQTTYNAKESPLAQSEADSLAKLFTLVDEAIVLRVGTLRWFSTEGAQGISFEIYEAKTESIIRELASLKVSSAIEKQKALIIEAIQSQRAFYADSDKRLKQNPTHRFALSNGKTFYPLILKASSELKSAYSLLMKNFPQETVHNKNAFFDHLCALDFI